MDDKNTIAPMGSSYSFAEPTPSDNTSLSTMNMERTLPRQISTGNYRGTQTITGALNIADPTTNNQVVSASGVDQYIVISDPTTTIPRIIIGKLPDDTYGIAISKPGIDVFSAFS